jgi:hypothetical protein
MGLESVFSPPSLLLLSRWVRGVGGSRMRKRICRVLSELDFWSLCSKSARLWELSIVALYSPKRGVER